MRRTSDVQRRIRSAAVNETMKKVAEGPLGWIVFSTADSPVLHLVTIRIPAISGCDMVDVRIGQWPRIISSSAFFVEF